MEAFAFECPHCGVIPSKWVARRPPGAGSRDPAPPGSGPAVHRPAGSPRAPASGGSTAGRIVKLLLLGLVGGVLVVGGYYQFVLRPRIEGGGGEPARPGRVRAAGIGPGAISGADQTLKLPSEPAGLAWNGRGFVVSARTDPWGIMRVPSTPDGYDVQHVPVTEPTYNQRVSFNGIAWNGREYVALAMGSWFQDTRPLVFVVLDANTLQIVRRAPAPDGIDAIAWDGSGYWVGTRKNTADEPGPATLQRLDESLQVIKTLDSPGPGCQGLAWDGSHLWMADVFTEKLYELDVSGDRLVVIGEHPLSVGYPSGLAWDGRHLWLGTYADGGAIHRISEATLAGWQGRLAAEPVAGEEAPAGSAAGTAVAPAEGDADELLAKVRAGSFDAEGAAVALKDMGRGEEAASILRDHLFSEDTFTRMHAKSALNAMGLPADRDRYSTIGDPDTGPEDTDLIELRAWMEGGDVHASWKIHVGETILAGVGDGPAGDDTISVPTFARYEISVGGDTLPTDIEREFPVTTETSTGDDEIIATGLGPGKYAVCVFIHVQYRKPEGHPMILNDNAGCVHVER